MNVVSRVLTGGSLIALGFILSWIPFLYHTDGRFVFWFWGIPLFILGFFILLNKNEDKIEGIKSRRR